MATELRTALDVTLTKAELERITAFVGDDDTEADDDAVRLLIGDGHGGYGLYASCPDYPEEGAILVKSLPAPVQQHRVTEGAPGATDAERAAWLADKIVAQGDYAKEAAEMLRRWPSQARRHQFWGAGEPDCPPDLKAANGELHTMRCKVCGDGWRKSKDVCDPIQRKGDGNA